MKHTYFDCDKKTNVSAKKRPNKKLKVWTVSPRLRKTDEAKLV